MEKDEIWKKIIEKTEEETKKQIGEFLKKEQVQKETKKVEMFTKCGSIAIALACLFGGYLWRQKKIEKIIDEMYVIQFVS